MFYSCHRERVTGMKTKRKHGHKLFLLLIVVSVLITAAVSFCASGNRVCTGIGSLRFFSQADKNAVELLLVNSKNPLPIGYETELLTLSNGVDIAEMIYPDLQEMFDDMRRQGIYPTVVSGYRSAEDQRRILEKKIAAFREEGFGKIQAKEMALQWVAAPGCSEHQTGLAVDINPDYEKKAGREVYDWLENHAHEYGFVKRYPSDKTEITGISNEPWHYRYVGREAAGEMVAHNLCLEEYLGYR